MTQKDNNYPSKVCSDCGLKASNGRSFQISTFHKAICDVCGKEKSVTQPRDFFYPEFDREKELNELTKQAQENDMGYLSYDAGRKS